MITVEKIKPEMTYNLRHKVLRPNMTVDDCVYTTDHEEGAFHVGAFYQGELISIASFCIEKNPDFSIDNQYRLRGMATLQEFRMLGAGRQLIDYAKNLLTEQNIDVLWCKARTSVQEYYSKLGFNIHGEVFDYPPIGPHIVMYKKLT